MSRTRIAEFLGRGGGPSPWALGRVPGRDGIASAIATVDRLTAAIGNGESLF